MPNKYQKHLSQFFNTYPQRSKMIVYNAVKSAGKEHVGVGFINMINQRSASQQQLANREALHLLEIDDKKVSAKDIVECLYKICSQGKDNNPGVASNWNVSKGITSYSSFNTIIMRNILLSSQVVNLLIKDKIVTQSDSNKYIVSLLELIAKETFDELMAEYSVGDYSKSKNEMLIIAKESLLMFDAEHEKTKDEVDDNSSNFSFSQR
jgi:hypothetical protein